MMLTVLDLCTKLGYPDAGSHGSRSSAKVLLDDLKAFVENEPVKNDPSTVTTHYLLSPVNVFMYPHSRTPDGHKITEMLSQLFSMIVQSRAMQDQVIDLEVPMSFVDNATVQASIAGPNEPGTQGLDENAQQHGVRDFHCQEPVPTTAEVHKDHVAQEARPMATIEPHDAEASIVLQDVMRDLVARGTSRDAGPITKLALREPTLVANLLRAGFSEPFPVTAPSEEQLVHMLNVWMAQYPDRSPPWLRPLNRGRLDNSYRNSASIFLASTLVEVYTSVRQMSPSGMTYILTDSDGSCMIGVPVAGNSMHERAYYGWLGGDLGFTSKPFVSTDGLGSRVSANETLSSRNDQAIVMADQDEPCLPFDHDDNIKKKTDLMSDIGVRPDAQPDPTNDIEIKNEPNLTEVRQATLRRIQAERQIQGPRWRFQTPPLSPTGTSKKFHWPPQYVSPPPTPQAKKRKASDAKTYKRRNIGGLLPNSNRSRTSSPEFVSESPISPPQGLRRSARANHFGSYRLSYRLPSLPKTSKRTRTTAKKSANSAEPAATTLQPSVQETPATKDVKIHFFLSNDSLGAVPVAMNECNTASSFFSQALSAWNLLGGGDHAETMAAVSVTIDGFHWPIVLPWGNATAFERMMETMTFAKTGKLGNLDVKVKCIKT